MKILVCGSRNWTNGRRMFDWLRDYPEGTTLIHGDCRGADRLAGAIGKILGFNVMVFPANWVKHGDAAGPIRNAEMLRQQPDIVVAFHENFNESRGTKDCLEQAQKRGIPFNLIDK